MTTYRQFSFDVCLPLKKENNTYLLTSNNSFFSSPVLLLLMLGYANCHSNLLTFTGGQLQ
jgi:hypothetical protein